MAIVTTLALLLALCQQSGEVPADRYQTLAIGVSANIQLAPPAPHVREKYDIAISEVDAKQLSDAGFRCVRLVFAPSDLFSVESLTSFDPKRIEKLLQLIEACQRSGLGVMLAPTLARQDLPTAAETLGRIAAVIGKTDPETTFLEVCSEPVGMDGAGWQLVQESWVAAIRENLPRHTIVVRAGGKDGPEDIQKMPLLSDKNLVYAFRFFEPVSFTNQCLPGSPIQEDDKVTLPYPPDAPKIVAMVAPLSDTQKDFAMRYAEDAWNSLKIDDIIHPVGDWAKSKRVRVICDGFGVSQKVDSGARAKYLQDLRTSFTNTGVGWTLSEYVGVRGVYTGSSGVRQPDSGLLGALGLSG